MIEQIPPQGTMVAHPLIRELSHMPCADTSTVDFKQMIHPTFLGEMAHDAISRRRTADIT
jgi:hypothetical protein